MGSMIERVTAASLSRAGGGTAYIKDKASRLWVSEENFSRLYRQSYFTRLFLVALLSSLQVGETISITLHLGIKTADRGMAPALQTRSPSR